MGPLAFDDIPEMPDFNASPALARLLHELPQRSPLQPGMSACTVTAFMDIPPGRRGVVLTEEVDGYVRFRTDTGRELQLPVGVLRQER